MEFAQHFGPLIWTDPVKLMMAFFNFERAGGRMIFNSIIRWRGFPLGGYWGANGAPWSANSRGRFDVESL